ncbi:MAG: hypothetical protein QF489_03820 [Planctomycetota bacterium]|jgi:hypothetical protein|nr:hypothetical protein [Planctomycetota bacterium]
MRLTSATALGVTAGGGLFFSGLVTIFCVVILGACSSDPIVEQDSADGGSGVAKQAQGNPSNPDATEESAEDGLQAAESPSDASVIFNEDPFAEAEVIDFDPNVVESSEGAPQEPEDEVVQEPGEFIFSEDPLSESDTQIVGSVADELGNTDTLWKGTKPESQLVELEAAPEPNYDEDLVQQSAELALAKLRARLVADELSREAKVLVPPGVRTFGELLPVVFQARNPFGDTVELIPPTTGLLLELDWTVQRWLPIGSSDKVKRHRYFRLNQWFLLEADQTFQEYTDLPLQLNGDAGSVWVVEVDARIRCAGAVFGDKQLPVHEIEFAAARFLVLPPGWEQFEEDPLGSLERVLAMASGEVDRHVLVCTALLRGEDRRRGVDALIHGLAIAPNDRRKLTITQALQWLTGVQLGVLPEDWLKWAELRKLSAVATATDHEPTPGNPTTQ